ncbi:MAG: phage integrase family protein [Candidatus Atribacteria bacterium]|nr:phage integrase family protein [Candidatus Atribacteria bacterium]
MQPGTRYPAEPLTREEMLRLFGVLSPTTTAGLRNRALLAVLYRCGLRVGEALALRPVDVDLEAGTVRVLHGKGDKARTVGMDFATCSMIADWLKRRALLGLNGSAPIFCTRTRRGMHRDCVNAMLRSAARRAGIERRIHAHGMRHTHACELAREGVPMNVIQQQLGHSSLSTTAVYLAHLQPQQVIDAIRGRDWRVPQPGDPLTRTGTDAPESKPPE